jgi:hypothetical protein
LPGEPIIPASIFGKSSIGMMPTMQPGAATSMHSPESNRI